MILLGFAVAFVNNWVHGIAHKVFYFVTLFLVVGGLFRMSSEPEPK